MNYTAMRRMLCLIVMAVLSYRCVMATDGVCDNGLKFQHITIADGLSDNKVQHVEPLEDRMMMIFTWRNINIYDGGRMTVYPRVNDRMMELPHYKYFYQVMTDSERRIWVKEWGQLWCLNLQKGEMEADFPALFSELGGEGWNDSMRVVDLFFDGRNQPYLLTDSGLWDAERQRMYGVSVDAVGDVAVVGEELFVFDTKGNVTVFDRGSGENMGEVVCENSRLNRRVYNFRLLTMDDGRCYRLIWVHGLARVDEFDARRREWRPVLEVDRALYHISSPDKRCLTIGTRHGLLELSSDSSFLDIGVVSPLKPTWTIHCPTRYYGGFYLDDGTALSDIVVHNLCSDWQGGIWMATGDFGLLYSHPKRYRIRSARTALELGIPDSMVAHSLHRQKKFYDAMQQRETDQLTDSRGRRWYATHTGVMIVDGKDTVRITEEDGLSSNNVLTLTEDARLRMWVGTNRGVCCIDEVSPLSVMTYGKDDGLPIWEVRPRGAVLLEDGRIALHCNQGWVAFHPDSIVRPEYGLTPILTGVEVNNRLWKEDSTEGLDLNYRQNNVSLTFAVCHYAFPNSVNYRWRIVSTAVGSAEEWYYRIGNTKGGQLTLDFMQLSPDKYRVEVQASTDFDFNDAAMLVYSVSVSPPWWHTWWAYSLYVAVCLLLLWWGMRIYLRQQRRTMLQKQREAMLYQRIQHLMEQTQALMPAMTSMQQEEVEETESDDEASVAEEKTISAEDSAFVQRAITLVEQHLLESYSVEQLAIDLCMERTGLYKRLTAIINQSPQVFIRSIRLNHAATMLRKGVSVTETAYGVGFSSLSHFSRCFTKEFGCPPSEFVQRENG